MTDGTFVSVYKAVVGTRGGRDCQDKKRVERKVHVVFCNILKTQGMERMAMRYIF
jgi:hypothetical protein